MNKIASRYQARFLNHNGDCFYFFWLVVITAAFVCIRFVVKFDKMGVPATGFEPIVPKDT
jgi:hypothetical protein